LNDIYNIPLI